MGYGIAGTAGFFEQLGWRPGKLFVLGAIGGEVGGGMLTLFGLGGPIGPALIIMVMLVAIFSVHISKGFAQSNGGYELNTMYVAAALAPAFNLGAYSLDRAFGLTILTSASAAWGTIGVAVLLAIVNLLVRRPAPAVQTAATT